MILTPKGLAPQINRTASTSGNACPADPYHYQRGEAGYFHDSQLGEAPDDFDLSSAYGYTPVNEGWTRTNQGLGPGGLHPGHLADANSTTQITVPSDNMTPEDREEMYRKRNFLLQEIGTSAVVISALFAIRKSLK